MKTTNAKHTVGPWRVDPDHHLCVEAPDGNVCLVNLARASRHDARLIAAAPELLEALKQCEFVMNAVRVYLPSHGTFSEQRINAFDSAQEQARAAIHKAQS